MDAFAPNSSAIHSLEPGVSDSRGLFGPSSNSYLAAAVRGVCQPRPQKLPGTGRLLNPRLSDPWSAFRLNNLVFMEKVQDDSRDWRFHREF
jgi:hypothetical protein